MKKETKKTTEKYVTEKTFEKSMGNIAKSFARQDDISEMILKEIKQIHEDNKYFKNSILDLNINGASCDRKIENLKVRVERLEMRDK